MSHAVLTGTITGRIPIDHPAFPAGHVDVTPDWVVFEGPDEDEHAAAVAAAIDAELHIRGTHPTQTEV